MPDSPLVLENFADNDTRSLNVLNLTTPNIEAQVAAEERGFSAGYGRGWNDGRAKAKTDHASEIAAFLEQLDDFGFTFDEARIEVAREYGLLFRMLLKRVFGKLIPEAVAAQLIEQIARPKDCGQSVFIASVSSADYETISRLLARYDDRVELAIDHTLPSGSASLSRAAREDIIDIDRFLAELTTVFDAYSDSLETENSDHG